MVDILLVVHGWERMKAEADKQLDREDRRLKNSKAVKEICLMP